MPLDVHKLLIQDLPKSLKVANGDTITGINWNPAGEEFARDAPYGTIQLFGETVTRPRVDRENVETTASASQAIAFVTGTTDYQVTERDIVSITSITGTRSGSPHTFSSSTDYEAVSTGDYSTKDAIRWKDGGNKPDNATNFTVTYTHRVIDIKVAIRSRVTCRLTLHVSILASGTRGATVTYGKDYLADQLKEALKKELMIRRAKSLSGVGDLVIGGFQNLRVLPVDAGESLARIVVDLTLERHQRELEEQVKTIGKAVPTVTGDV